MMVDTCNPSSQEAKIGVLRVPSQPGLHGKTLSQNNQKKEKKSTYIISSKTGEKWGERKRQTEKMGCEVLIPGPAKPSIFWLYRRQ